MQENVEVSLWRSSLAQGMADGTSYLQCALMLLAVVRFRALHTVPHTGSSHRLVRTLQQNPAIEDFVYLRRAKRQPADVNPYALQVIHLPALCRAPPAKQRLLQVLCTM